MKLKRIAALAAASSLVLSSVATAHPLSLSNAPVSRASAATDSANALNGSTTMTRLAVLALLALLIWGGIEVFDNNDEPGSP